MRSRKNSQSDSANYYGTNQITSIANQQANWLIPDSDGLSQNLNLNNENHRHGSIGKFTINENPHLKLI